MKTIITCMAIIMAMIIISCNKGNKESTLENLVVQDKEIQAAPKQEDAKGMLSTLSDTTAAVANSIVTPEQTLKDVLQAGKPVPPIDWDKKIIKTANLTLELKDYKQYNTNMHRDLKGYGAYIASEQQNENDERITNSVTIKVPVDKFEDLINALPAEGVKVVEKRINTDDVTGEVVDTKSRIEAKKQVRARYINLLKQAKNMEEILQVQSEINSIHEELESATGRVNYLVHQSSYSTINLTYYQFLNGATQRDIQPTFFSKLGEAFSNGSSIIIGLLLFIVTIWPLLIFGIIGYLLVKRWKLKVIKTS